MTDNDARPWPPHRPSHLYCSDPEQCCYTWDPLAVLCATCGQRWPCDTKRSHHTPTENARIERWARGRAHREAKET